MANNTERKSLTLLEKLAKLSPSLAADAEKYAATYAPLATKLQPAASTLSAIKADAKEIRNNTWQTMKSAIGMAVEAGHDANALQTGIMVACESLNIPKGTFNGYITPLKGMLTDHAAGKMTAEEIAKLSVADARKRYHDKTPEVILRERRDTAWASLTNEQRLQLVELAEEQAEANKAAKDAEKAGVKVADSEPEARTGTEG